MHKSTPPLSVAGIPLKPLVFIGIVLLIVLADIRCARIGDIGTRLIFDSIDRRTPSTPADLTPNDIVATPEMITRAQLGIIAARIAEQENSATADPDDRFFYIVELHSGGDLESFDLTIRPDEIILHSAAGIRTVIPRESVKQIHRIKLPADQPE
jgi:hypothetical protein